MNLRVVHCVVLLALCAGLAMGAPQGQRGRSNRDSNYATQNSTCNDVPAHPLDIILGRPTQTSVTISVLAYQDTEGSIAYGTQQDQLNRQTPKRQFKRGEPGEVVIGSLQPDAQYFYEFRGRGVDKGQGTFHTQRPRGSSFTFTITADSHLDDRASAELYLRTLANAVADKPDFHVDLGDTFMTEKHDNRENAARQYVAQRYYFGQVCRSAPLFLVLGNHDGESPRGRGSDADTLAVWSNLMRKRYFPNPVPDGFYTGNAAKHPQAGLLQDYYAWQWGDALFVVLDPYWFTQKQRGMSDNWKHTLGREQYLWLGRTLEASKAKYKFIFIHHLVGGLNDQCRGGAEAAPLFEWGGQNVDGSNGFRQNRPGWPMPIHQLLVRNQVSAVFHGHDHMYVKQDLDGIVYQEVPQPGTPGNNATRTAAEYGYKSGVILSSAGHLRVRVAPEAVTVDYVRATPPDGQRSDRSESTGGHTYTIAPAPTPTKRGAQ